MKYEHNEGYFTIEGKASEVVHALDIGKSPDLMHLLMGAYAAMHYAGVPLIDVDFGNEPEGYNEQPLRLLIEPGKRLRIELIGSTDDAQSH